MNDPFTSTSLVQLHVGVLDVYRLEYGNLTRPLGCEGYEYDHSTVDNSLAMEFGLVCDEAYRVGFSQTVYFVGMMSGVMFAGVLSDKYGRKIVLIGMMLAFSLMGVLSALAPTYELFLAARFLVAAGSSGINMKSVLKYEIRNF